MIKAGTRSVTLVVLGVIALVLAIYLAITLAKGDTSNDLEENQPTPSPSRAAPS